MLLQAGADSITVDDVMAAAHAASEGQRQQYFTDREALQTLVQDLYLRRMLARQARERALDQSPAGRVTLQLAQERALSELRLAEIDAASRLSDAQWEQKAREVHASEPARFSRPEQIHARHILIGFGADKAQARQRAEALRQQLQQGASFEELARTQSSDTITAGRGGDLGWVIRGGMVKPFDDAVAKMQPGQLSEVVETVYGYHVIRLEGRRPPELIPFEQVQGDLVPRLQHEAQTDGRRRVVEPFLKQQPDDAALRAFIQSKPQ